MDDVIFVKTRHIYQSYTDFWDLVELSRFPTVYTDEVDIQKQVVYILCPMNGEWKPRIDFQRGIGKERKAKLIQWNVERPGGSGTLDHYCTDNQSLIDAGYFDEIWVSDRELAKICKFSYAILGGNELFAKQYHTNITDKTFDLIHLSYGSPRRSFLFDAPGICKKFIAGCSIAPNSWGIARHNYLQASKYMLNIHQDEYPYIEPLRFVIAAMYKLPIITEFCLDSYPYDVIDIGRLVQNGVQRQQFFMSLEVASKYADKNGNYDTLRNSNYRRMTEEYTFRKAVEAIL